MCWCAQTKAGALAGPFVHARLGSPHHPYLGDFNRSKRALSQNHPVRWCRFCSGDSLVFSTKPSPSITSPVRALRCSMHAMQEAARRLVSATAVLILPSTNQNARLAAKDCAIAITKAKATPFVCCEGFSAFRSWVSLGLHPFLLLKVVTAGRFPQSGQLQSTRRM